MRKQIELRLKGGVPVIDMNDPWCDDVLHRHQSAKYLMRLVLSSQEPTTIFINGAWGSGKTFFLQRWLADLSNNGAFALLYNAWEDDGIADPMLSLIGQLHMYLHNQPKYRNCWNCVWKIAERMFLAGLDEMSYAVEHVTGVNPERAVSKCGSKVAQMLEQYKEAKKQQGLFSERLVGLAHKIQHETNYPLIIVVDELDRCVPLYAVRVLERIKHFFMVPNVVFVIGIDRDQFGHTIRSVYGDIDVDNYLHRFVDFEFSLPMPDRQKFIELLWGRSCIDNVLRDVGCKTKLNARLGSARKIICALSKLHGLSLREIETSFRYFVLALRMSDDRKLFPADLAAVMSVLKVKNAEIVEDWVGCNIDAPSIVDSILPVDTILDSSLIAEIVAVVYATQYSEVADIARAANVFIDLCRTKNLNGDEFKVRVPQCVLRMKNAELRNIADLVDQYHKSRNYRSSSHAMLLQLASKEGFAQYDASIYKGMRNDIISAMSVQKYSNHNDRTCRTVKVSADSIQLKIHNVG